ncbi:SOS response-associated peptidase family protein [Siphonobacter sp. SORGH_AS_0500]|uniref:SOS response-associated peptidase family protein n=1 Tax=Siphonobacter sp. SORGH_AS_0500 TaxID=1864824 RepID=UPI00286265B2|nr:SOS response-associated peptidase family protein [Siphonobacter sp. SORGH_AS_0500]MDR6197266.1 putative SOS response-associated peptidase YedK [Siphonobacter sp. SORGH_AS_0500]
MYIGLGIGKKLKDIQQRFNVEKVTSQTRKYLPVTQADAETLPYWPIITSQSPTALQQFRWGLLSTTTKPEQVESTPLRRLHVPSHDLALKAYAREPFQNGQRALVLADRFFVHRKEGKNQVLYQLSLRYNQLFALAGIYETWQQEDQVIPTFTLITTPGNSLLKFINNVTGLMPVIIDPEHESLWLSDRSSDDPAITSLLQPFDEKQMKALRLTHTDQLSLFEPSPF